MDAFLLFLIFLFLLLDLTNRWRLRMCSTQKRILSLEMETNGVDDNCTEDKINGNIENNQPSIMESKPEMGAPMSPNSTKTGKPVDDSNQTNGPVITVQPPATNGSSSPEKPRRRPRRTSDVIDSIGMDPNHSPLDRRGSGDIFFPGGTNSPSDGGYSSNPSSPRSPTKPPDNRRPRLADTIDAAPIGDESPPSPPSPSGGDDTLMSFPVVEAVMPVHQEAEEYNMNHPRRGHAVIFNNEEFEMPGYSNREGSEIDVKNLEKLFTALGFEITVHHNRYYNEIVGIVGNLALQDHSDADCLVVTVLSHGIAPGVLLAKDFPYKVECLWNPFTADKCPTLAGKPKIFFIQACRGASFDPGVKLTRRASRTETDSGTDSYKIPTHADFLLAFSSVEGFYSFRNPGAGTWFIQCLCKEMSENGEKYDLLKLLTRTARRVAVDFQSYNDLIPWQNEQKQVPTITSMLIRDVYFRPKK